MSQEFPSNPEIARLETHFSCLATIESELNNITGAAEVLDDGHETTNASVLAEVLSDKIKDALDYEEIEAAEKYLDSLLLIPGHHKERVVVASLSLAEKGSTKAFSTLCDVLEAEKGEITEHLTLHSQKGLSVPEFSMHAPALSALLKECEIRNAPISQWIETYAANDLYKWQLEVDHFARIAKKEETFKAYVDLEDKIGELYSDKFSDVITYQAIARVLSFVRSPDEKERMVAEFRKVANRIDLSPTSFRTFCTATTGFLNSPGFLTEEDVTSFDVEITQYATALSDAGLAPTRLAAMQLGWRLSKVRYEGVSPEEFVHFLDLHIGQVLAAKNDHGADQQTLSIREDLLDAIARQHIEKGDLQYASILYNAQRSGEIKERLLKELLNHTTSISQVDALSPDELSLAMNPQLELFADVYKAKHSNDIEAMTSTLKRVAGEMANDDETLFSCVIQLFATTLATDKSQALLAAREIATALRAKQSYAHFIGPFAQELIAAGDAEEATFFLADILERSASPSTRLSSLWKLAKILR